MRKQELFNKADYYKNLIDRNKLFHSEKQVELDEFFRIGFIYNSKSIEGNTLSLSETKTLIENGITINGKPLKDNNEVAGLTQAFDYMLSLARTEQLNITVDLIKKLHYLLKQNMDPDEAGLYRKTQEYVSSTQYLPPKAEDVEHLMEHFINQMQTSRKFMHPIEFAAMSHKRLVDIHPFKDGNEIIAGLFMNLILVNAGYGITTIPSELRNEYSNALKMTQIKNNLDIDAFISFIAERVMETEKEYCRSLGIE